MKLVRARVYDEQPVDVQEVLRLILWYLEHTEKPRPLYPASIKRACRLLKVMGEARSQPRTWVLSKEWKERLRLAGLDPRDPLRVVSQRRWNNAWAQLVETGTFRDDRAQRDIATGKKSPKAEPIIRAKVFRPKREQRTETVFKMPKLK